MRAPLLVRWVWARVRVTRAGYCVTSPAKCGLQRVSWRARSRVLRRGRGEPGNHGVGRAAGRRDINIACGERAVPAVRIRATVRDAGCSYLGHDGAFAERARPVLGTPVRVISRRYGCFYRTRRRPRSKLPSRAHIRPSDTVYGARGMQAWAAQALALTGCACLWAGTAPTRSGARLGPRHVLARARLAGAGPRRPVVVDRTRRGRPQLATSPRGPEARWFSKAAFHGEGAAISDRLRRAGVDADWIAPRAVRACAATPAARPDRQLAALISRRAYPLSEGRRWSMPRGRARCKVLLGLSLRQEGEH